MDLYNNDKYSVSPEKTPTLRQYLKAKGKGKIPKSFHVTKIWTPGKYPSFTIETEHFRTTVGQSTEIGRLLGANLDQLECSTTSTLVTVHREKGEKPTISFSEGTNTGYWGTIGQDTVYGLEWIND